jgi:hypothetical protein
MTDDEELIARLRSKIIIHTDAAVWMLEAAGRLDVLDGERDEADDLAKAAFADGASNNIRLAETSYRVKWLEAKLAKAVEALQWCAMYGDGDVARATLAEIKGESHD